MADLAPWQHCLHAKATEHAVWENTVSYDGYVYSGWCYFCGELVTASDTSKPWEPVRPYLITEEFELILGVN